MKKKKRILPRSSKVLLFPLLAFLVITALIVMSLNMGIPRVKSQLEDLQSLEDREEVLSQRVFELNNAQDLSQLAKNASFALPGRAPSLQLISQLKKIAEKNSVILIDLSASGSRSVENNTFEVGVNMTALGNIEDILHFALDMKNYAPVISVRGIDADLEGSDASVDIAVIGHYSPFPENLPDLDTPINKITNEDIQILTRLSALLKPSFSVGVPSGRSSRSNPFSY